MRRLQLLVEGPPTERGIGRRPGGPGAEHDPLDGGSQRTPLPTGPLGARTGVMIVEYVHVRRRFVAGRGDGRGEHEHRRPELLLTVARAAIGQPINRIVYDENGNRQQQQATTTITAPPTTTTPPADHDHGSDHTTTTTDDSTDRRRPRPPRRQFRPDDHHDRRRPRRRRRPTARRRPCRTSPITGSGQLRPLGALECGSTLTRVGRSLGERRLASSGTFTRIERRDQSTSCVTD